jgi:streptomycin 3"-adenylyltransferase
VVERLLSISGWRTPEGRWRRVELTVVPASEVRPWRFPPRFDLQYGDWLRSAFERGEVEPWPTNENPDLAVLLTVVLLAGRPVLGPPPAEVLDPWRTRISSAPWSTASTPARGPRRGHAQRRPHARADLEHRRDGGDPLEGRRGRVGAPAASDEHRAVLSRARTIYLGGQEEQWHDLAGRVRAHADHVAPEISRLCRASPGS